MAFYLPVKGDGGEKGFVAQPLGTKKVNEWFARNEAVRLKETVATDVLNSAKFDVAELPLGSSSPCRKKEAGEVGCVETNLAVKDLNRMLKHASAAALMTTRETSLALQDLVPLLPSSALHFCSLLSARQVTTSTWWRSTPLAAESFKCFLSRTATGSNLIS